MTVQQLTVELSIPIPADQVIISKVELEQYKALELTGVYWTMKDVEKRTGKKSEWLKEHVFYQPFFRKRLDAENGGFVYYPKSQGQPWAFQAAKTAKFFDDNFHLIFK